MVCDKRKLSEADAVAGVNKDILNLLNGKKDRRPLRTAYYCEGCKAWHVSTMTITNPCLKIKKL